MRTIRHTRRPRYGAALVYSIVGMTAFMGVVSLAVDLGRYEVAHSQLYNAAVAAARAGAAAIPNGSSAATTAATNAAINNQIDGQAITSAMVTVEYVNWTSSSNNSVVSAANFAQCNAIRVSIAYSVPLTFAKIIGLANKSAVEHSTAKLTIQTDSPYVYATGDVWLAGEPAGTHASQADPNYAGLHVNSDHQYPDDIAGTPGGLIGSGTRYTSVEQSSSPVQSALTLIPYATITITNVSGLSSYDWQTSHYVDATGNNGTSWICDNAKASSTGSEHGIADATMPISSLNAVFLDNNLPDSTAAPAALDFSSAAARDYTSISPKLKQPFYCGTGTTSTGKQQEIVVPPNASRLFLGTMDSWEWDNNRGGFQVTITQKLITTVE